MPVPRTRPTHLAPTTDSGHLTQSGGVSVFFTGLEPVQVLGAGAGDTLTVNGTPADNAINYTAGTNAGAGIFGGVGATGLVTVDNFESIEFSNFGTLNLDAGAGSDEINLNNPTAPTGLADIIVNGGDPTASDTLIVNGTTGADAIERCAARLEEYHSAVVGGPVGEFGEPECVSVEGNGSVEVVDRQCHP